MKTYPSILQADLSGKKVIVRAGFDVPIDNGVVSDKTRIEAMIPTMQHVLKNAGSLILLAHQGRPKAKRIPEMSQKPLVPVLEDLLGVPVQFSEECVGDAVQARADSLQEGEVLLL